MRRLTGAAVLVSSAGLLGAYLLLPHIADAQQQGTITLIGTVASNCTLNITANSSALNLDLATGSRRVEVGTALQNCNKKAGYTIHVLSQNCANGTPGAKLLGTLGGETLRYSVEFNNPATGGSQSVVTGLLDNACSGASKIVGREVTNEKVRDELSRIYVNYQGDSTLAADSYSDTLTLTLVVK